MKFPIHKSESGSFQELAHNDDVEFGQLSILTVGPRMTRGGHYHTHKREWFCCISGFCNIEMFNPQNSDEETIVLLDEESPEFVLVPPGKVHYVKNPSSLFSCTLLIIANEKFDPMNPDTFPYEDEFK